MTPEQIGLVRQSWATVEPSATQLAAAFYTRLFALDPKIAAALAHVGREAQARKFALTLTTLVASLDDPETFVPLLARLGRDHAAIGLSERQYRIFGDTLLATLQTALAPSWDQTLHEAWAETYLLAASIMQRAGRRFSGALGGLET